MAKRRWEAKHSPDHYLNPELARLIEPFTRGQDRRKYLGREVRVTDDVAV